MAKQDIFVDTKQIERLTFELKGFEEKVGTATYHALKRTVSHVRTQIGRIIPKSYAIKASDVKRTLSSKEPSLKDLSATITSKGHTLSFAHFPFTPRKPKKIRRSIFENAVMVTIKKDRGKVLSRTGFVATTGAKSADKVQFNVFKRLGKDRLPIAPIRTLSIPQMITNEGVAEQIQRAAADKLDERFEHEIIRSMTTMGNNIKRG
ncbi:phage tail protein [Desulfitobacterium hafniense]|uniref:phage tail protein n=1 Tax=Desulfitobacterium hafniense TaxID=49338 RepID=UPI0002FD163B|nr:phage tail protein [Desulfitobacterium hafniense]